MEVLESSTGNALSDLMSHRELADAYGQERQRREALEVENRRLKMGVDSGADLADKLWDALCQECCGERDHIHTVALPMLTREDLVRAIARLKK